MRKINILFVLFLFIIPLVSAGMTIYAGQESKIYHIDSCYGEVMINVYGKYAINDTEYNLKDCTFRNSAWYCDCRDNMDIILSTKSNTLNEYSFNIQWYIEKTTTSTGGSTGTSPYILALIKARQEATKIPTNTTTLSGATTTTMIPTAEDIEVDNLKRYDEVNDVVVTPNNSTVIKEDEKMSDINFGFVFIIILGVFLFVSALVYLFYVIMFREKGPKNVIDEKIYKKEEPKKNGSLTQKEIQELMDKYAKEK